MDGWVTPSSTFAKGWRASRVTVLWLLQPDQVSLDSLDVITSGVAQMQQAAVATNGTVTVRSGVSELVDSVVEGQRQARTIVPLLIGQLAVLAVVVLGLVAAAAVEQRRPELALGRLRGRGPSGAAAMVLRELGTVVAAGVPLGYLLALGLGEVARRLWLAPGVPLEVPGTTVVAALIALLVAVLAVVLVARPTLREPISTLLRRVPPRRRGWAVGVVDAVVIAVALAGLVTLVSGNLSGPLALATPTLLALALGLVLAHVLVPLADLVARALTRRGRLVGALTAVQVARRPAVRRIMAIITVATALTVFATDALVVGARNRDERARVETGAEAVLTTNASDANALVAAVKTADPSGTVATPVIRVRQGSATALRTLAVIPDQFGRIAELPRDPGAFPWARLDSRPPEGIILTGRHFTVTLDGASAVATSPDAQARGGTGALPPPTLVVYLAPAGSQALAVNVGELPSGATTSVTLARDVACAGGCQLAGFAIATPTGSSEPLRGTVTISNVSMDGSPPAAIGDAAEWLPSGHPEAPPEQLQAYAKPVDAGSPARLGLTFQATLDDVRITARSSIAALPALVAGSLPNGAPGPAFQAAGLDGITLDFQRIAPVPYAPGGGTDEAIVSLPSLLDRSASIAPLAQAQVWVADATAVARIRAALTRSGVTVTSVETRADLQELYDSSASAWGLRLALVVGLLALLIAGIVLVLVAVTTWRGRSRDYAALRMAGVGASALRRVALGEQWTVVAVSVVVGAAAGVLGAQLAMPIIPFFTVASTALSVDTAPAVPQTVAAAAAALAALLLVGWVVGVRLVARASLSRVREPL